MIFTTDQAGDIFWQRSPIDEKRLLIRKAALQDRGGLITLCQRAHQLGIVDGKRAVRRELLAQLTAKEIADGGA